MKTKLRILSFLLSLAIVLGLSSGMASALSISDSGFTKIGSIPNDYVATQGMCTDGTYIYTFKMPSGNNNLARFYRTSISSGTTSLMKYTDDTSLTNFVGMGHGNDMCAVVHNGVTYLYVTTMYHKTHSTFATHSIWKYQVSGNNLKKVAYYDVMQGTTDRNFTGLTVFKQTSTTVTLLGANGQNVYAMDIPLSQGNGTVSCTKAFTINYTSASTPTSAPTYTYQSGSTKYYDVQGMTYDNGRLYYIMTANENKTPRRHNYIFAYNISDYPGNSGARTAIAAESIYVTSSTYSYFLEFESIDIHNGVMYFSANAGKSGYYENYDFCGKLKQTFTVTPEYTVTFCNEAGTTLQSVKVKKGETAKYTGSTPTKAYDATNHYTFSNKWLTSVGGSEATLTNITANLKVYAGFTATAHSYTEKITTQPSCSAEGVKTFTCTCGRSYTEAVSKTEHTPTVVNAKAATCSAEGYTGDTVCSVCNVTLSTGSAIEKLAHTPIVVNGKEATCTSEGYTGNTVCSVCNASISAGTTIAKLPHTPVTDKGYAATCSAEGLSDGSHCGVCGEILTAQTVLPTTEHNAVVIPGTPATCVNSGVSDGLQCADCGVILQAQTVTARLGHDYHYANNGDNHIGTCSRCSKTVTQAHSFVDNSCICGATVSTEPVLDETIVIQHSLNLASDIAINYVVKSSLLEGYDGYYLECVIPEYENNVQVGTRTVTVEPVLKGNYYYFTLEGLNAISMNHEVDATLYMTKSGQAYRSNVDTFSVATYAYAQLNQAGTKESLKVLCANLLRYGSLAQQYKNYCTDNLPDSKLTEEQKAYLVDLNTVTFDNVNSILSDIINPEITWVGKTMILDSKVILKFVFDAAGYAGDPADLSLRVTYVNTSGQSVTSVVSNPKLYQAGTTRYAFDFDGLLAAELRSALSVTVCMGDLQVSPTLLYSASSYGNNATGTLQSLCKALMAYSDCAKAFFKG